MFSFTWIIWYWDFLCVNFRNGKTCSVCLESRVVTDQTRRGDWTRNPSMNSVKFPFSVYICFEYMIQYQSNNNIYAEGNSVGQTDSWELSWTQVRAEKVCNKHWICLASKALNSEKEIFLSIEEIHFLHFLVLSKSLAGAAARQLASWNCTDATSAATLSLFGTRVSLLFTNPKKRECRSYLQTRKGKL